MEGVLFSTTMGDFTVELYPNQAPRTCKNFTELCAPRPDMPTSPPVRKSRYAVAANHRKFSAASSTEKPNYFHRMADRR